MFLAASWVRYWAESLQPKTYLFTNSLKNNFAFILLSVLRLTIFACVSSGRKLFSTSILGSVFSDYVVFYGDSVRYKWRHININTLPFLNFL